jgi:WD40 repeat protein
MRLFYAAFLLVMMLLSTVVHAQGTQATETARSLEWSPNGRILAIGTETTISFYDTRTYELVQRFDNLGWVSNFSWNNNGTKLAAIVPGEMWTKLTLWDLNAPDTAPITTEDIIGESLHNQIAWSPDDRYVAVYGSVWIYIFDTSTGIKVHTLWDESKTHNTAVSSLNWASDNRTLYALYSGRTNALLAWGVTEERVKYIFLSGLLSYPKAMDLSDDSQFIIVDQGITLLILEAATGDLLKTITDVAPGKFNIKDIFWRPGGEQIIGVTNDRIMTWDAQSGALIDVQTLPPTYYVGLRDVALSPQGVQLGVILKSTPDISSTKDFAVTTAQSNLSPIYGEALQILVPAPSLALLDSIQAACAPTKPPAALPTTDNLATYIDAINADASIPPACAADLIAVAEALLIP